MAEVFLLAPGFRLRRRRGVDDDDDDDDWIGLQVKLALSLDRKSVV